MSDLALLSRCSPLVFNHRSLIVALIITCNYITFIVHFRLFCDLIFSEWDSADRTLWSSLCDNCSLTKIPTNKEPGWRQQQQQPPATIPTTSGHTTIHSVYLSGRDGLLHRAARTHTEAAANRLLLCCAPWAQRREPASTVCPHQNSKQNATASCYYPLPTGGWLVGLFVCLPLHNAIYLWLAILLAPRPHIPRHPAASAAAACPPHTEYYQHSLQCAKICACVPSLKTLSRCRESIDLCTLATLWQGEWVYLLLPFSTCCVIFTFKLTFASSPAWVNGIFLLGTQHFCFCSPPKLISYWAPTACLSTG